MEESKTWRELSMLDKKWLSSFRKELKSQGKTTIHKMPDNSEKSHYQFMLDDLKTVFVKQHSDMKNNGLLSDVLSMEKIYKSAMKSLESLGAPKVKKTFMARAKPTRGRGRGGASKGGRRKSQPDNISEESEDSNIEEKEDPDIGKPTKPTKTKSQHPRKSKKPIKCDDVFDDESDGNELEV